MLFKLGQETDEMEMEKYYFLLMKQIHVATISYFRIKMIDK